MKINRKQLRKLIMEELSVSRATRSAESYEHAIADTLKTTDTEWADIVKLMNEKYPEASEALHIIPIDELRDSTIFQMTQDGLFDGKGNRHMTPEAQVDQDMYIEQIRTRHSSFYKHLMKLFRNGYVREGDQSLEDLEAAILEFKPDAFESPRY